MNKEELDRIFQQGADRYDFEYTPAAWTHMEQLLQEQRRRRWILWCFWGGFGVLSLILFIWLFIGQDNEDTATDPLSPTTPASQPLRAHAKEAVPAGDVAPGPQFPAVLPINPANQQIDRQKPIAERTGAGGGAPGPKETKTSAPPRMKADDRQPARPPAGKETVAENDKKTKADDPGQRQPEPYVRSQIANLAFLPAKSATLVHHRVEIHFGTDAVLSRAPIVPSNEKASRLVFSAQVAPNYSNVRMNDQLERGGSVGVSIAYLIGAKQMIGLGVELSKKAYLADGGDYKPPYGFWTRRIAPTETFGSCTILEIPLSFTRRFGPLHLPGGFAQVGLASYLMLRENYYYHYEQSDPDLIRWWGTKNDNQHWLSVVNLAGGFSYPLGAKYALSLGPFLNIPLGGVGHGEVKLYSLGIKLGMDFRP